jgi:outer membrane protein assembly factor BamE (lipoprotein component of BamABCDE complex)
MNKLPLLLVLAFLLILPSCQKKALHLGGFDTSTWQKDRMGCEGLRSQMVDKLEDIKEQLMGIKSEDIAELLGMPDKNELYKRNQKFFVYYIDPAPECAGYDRHHTRTLQLRFNATEKVNEVMVYY